MENNEVQKTLGSVIQKLRLSQNTSTPTKRTEISLYEGGELPDKEFIINQLKRLHNAFPQLKREYMVTLNERITDKKMTKEQIHDAVSRVIDTCVYPVPGMAEILSFDQRVKLYTHKQILLKLDEGYTFQDFEQIEIEGKLKWIEK